MGKHCKDFSKKEQRELNYWLVAEFIDVLSCFDLQSKTGRDWESFGVGKRKQFRKIMEAALESTRDAEEWFMLQKRTREEKERGKSMKGGRDV